MVSETQMIFTKWCRSVILVEVYTTVLINSLPYNRHRPGHLTANHPDHDDRNLYILAQVRLRAEIGLLRTPSLT